MNVETRCREVQKNQMKNVEPLMEQSVDRYMIQAKNCTARNRRDIAEFALNSALRIANRRSDIRRILLWAETHHFIGIKGLALERIIEIEGLDEDDPVHRDWAKSLALYEELLAVKNGRTQLAGRTRQKIKRHGVISLLRLVIVPARHLF